MNILITNDDGINSPGIYALVKRFIYEGNIIVSAPDRQRSASSHSITMHEPISVSKVDFFDIKCNAYAVSGTPVDCVKLAYEQFANGNIDLVVSGINDGANLGTDVLYSGTVSAAIEGAILNVPAIAVSLIKSNGERDYEVAADYAYNIYKSFMSESFEPGTILNINVPACKRENIKGIAATVLGSVRYTNSYVERKDPRGNIYYWLAGEPVKMENGNTTDIYAVNNNYVSVTPMNFELTKFEYLDKIKSWFQEG